MTREEAIQVLKDYRTIVMNCLEAETPAFDMAIEALSEPNMIPIKLEKRYPHSRDEDITDAFMRGYQSAQAELVRCKDCRHRDLFSCPLADNDFQKDDDFCSWGERREPWQTL